MPNKDMLYRLMLFGPMIMLLVACANVSTPQAGTEEGTTATSEETVTLTIWDFGGIDFEWIDEIAIPRFQEIHPHIQFDHIGVPESELPLKLETAIAAGQLPDLVVFVPPRLIQAGHVLALGDYMERDGLRPADFCPLFQSRDMLNGQVYSLPSISNVWAMMYNKDLFEEANLPELNTESVIDYNDWLNYARALNKPADSLEERVWGSAHFVPAWNSMNNYLSDPFVLGADGRSCQINAETEDWIATWSALQTAYQEDLTPETSGTLAVDLGMTDLFNQGKLGMTYASLGDAIAAQQAGINVGLTGQPVVTPGWEHNVGGWNTSYSIMARSAHPDEAWEFLKFLSTELAGELAGLGSGGEVGGVPCYLPLYDEFLAAQGNESLASDAVELSSRIAPAPFTPDLWTSVNPFDEAWRRMTEDNENPATAVSDAALQCQTVTDELWQDWELLGE